MTNEYLQQAEKFLADTGTTLTVEYLRTAPYFYGSKENRDIYRFTLKNTRGEYSREFGNSIKATKARALASKYKTPSQTWDLPPQKAAQVKAKIAQHNATPKPDAYDILAGIEKYEVDPIFENWARESGYDVVPLHDYSKIRALHEGCLAQYVGLRKLFTAEQMEQLQEIR